jgi:hypothetical protein
LLVKKKKKNILGAYANNGLRKRKIQCDGTGCDEEICCLGCKCCVEKSKRIIELMAKLTKKKKTLLVSSE